MTCWRRRRVRYDKRADIHEAVLSPGCPLICWQSLRRTWRTAWGMPTSPAPIAKSPFGVIASAPLLWGLRGQAPGIGLHYGV
jgi:hypothetical protein